jgi:hypothetical protein
LQNCAPDFAFPMDLKALLSNPKKAPMATVLVLGALVYFGAVELGLALADVNPHVAPVTPAAGLAVALLMVFGLRAWPAIAFGALAAHGLAGGGIGISAPIAAGDTLAAIAGQLVLSRNPPGTASGCRSAPRSATPRLRCWRRSFPLPSVFTPCMRRRCSATPRWSKSG